MSLPDCTGKTAMKFPTSSIRYALKGKCGKRARKENDQISFLLRVGSWGDPASSLGSPGPGRQESVGRGRSQAGAGPAEKAGS